MVIDAQLCQVTKIINYTLKTGKFYVLYVNDTAIKSRFLNGFSTLKLKQFGQPPLVALMDLATPRIKERKLGKT